MPISMVCTLSLRAAITDQPVYLLGKSWPSSAFRAIGAVRRTAQLAKRAVGTLFRNCYSKVLMILRWMVHLGPPPLRL
jgi:hypothetical protein